jgi:hypothetical protein
MARIALLLMSVVLVACESLPNAPDPSAKPGQGAIGIEVGIRPPLPIGTYATQQVYFARIGEQDEPVLDSLYVTTFFNEGRAYALNVPPGRYAAVAGVFKVMGDTYISYFPRTVVNRTISLASEGKLAFAGRYVLDSNVGVCPDKADELQIRIAEVLSPGVPKCGLLRMAIHETFKQGFIVIQGTAIALGPSTVHYGGVLREAHRDDAAARTFHDAARKDLQGRGWDMPSTAATD